MNLMVVNDPEPGSLRQTACSAPRSETGWRFMRLRLLGYGAPVLVPRQLLHRANGSAINYTVSQTCVPIAHRLVRALAMVFVTHFFCESDPATVWSAKQDARRV